MEKRFESLGVRWKINGGNVHTPVARDAGPNQILLLENYFRNGHIEAVIQPVTLQPYLEASQEDQVGMRSRGPLSRPR